MIKARKKIKLSKVIGGWGGAVLGSMVREGPSEEVTRMRETQGEQRPSEVDG